MKKSLSSEGIESQAWTPCFRQSNSIIEPRYWPNVLPNMPHTCSMGARSGDLTVGKLGFLGAEDIVWQLFRMIADDLPPFEIIYIIII